MTTEFTKNVRDWLNFALTCITVLIIPVSLLILRNERLEIRDEIRREYVNKETALSDHNYLVAENVKLAGDVTEIKITLSQIQIQLARLTDAVKLKQPQN